MTPLVSLSSVSKSFGIRSLFSEISLVIAEGDRVALIGPNGAGKSTLFRIMAGLEDPDEGRVSMKKGLSLGYVPQSVDLHLDTPVGELLRSRCSPDDPDCEAKVSRALATIGLSDSQATVRELSGGWQKRVAIVAGLIHTPELLLLDEPTNHLDIDSIVWLEELLPTLRCAVVCISHDRYFIERTATRVIELDRVYPKGFLAGEGSYSDFLETKELFLAQRESHRESVANKVRREVEWLRQGVKARGTKARGRIKQAGVLIEELSTLKTNTKSVTLEFSESGRRTKELAHLEGVGYRLPDRTLFKDLTVTLSPGIRLGIVGANGAGKTTLLKILIGSLQPTQGTIRRAVGLRTVYFDQQREELDGSLTLKRALCPDGDSVIFNSQEIHVASWARKFLFSTDHLSIPVRELSGGERARVLLARLMIQPADLLVLDEPTNDLDIPTLEILEETLCEFSGALVLVTHDRHLLDRVCTRLVGLKGSPQKIDNSGPSNDGAVGFYADYAQWDAVRKSAPKESAKDTDREERSTTTKKNSSSERSNSQKLTYAERIELGAMEKNITKAEAEVENIHKELADPIKASDHAWLTKRCDDLAQREERVRELYARWDELEKKRAVAGE